VLEVRLVEVESASVGGACLCLQGFLLWFCRHFFMLFDWEKDRERKREGGGTGEGM